MTCLDWQELLLFSYDCDRAVFFSLQITGFVAYVQLKKSLQSMTEHDFKTIISNYILVCDLCNYSIIIRQQFSFISNMVSAN